MCGYIINVYFLLGFIDFHFYMRSSGVFISIMCSAALATARSAFALKSYSSFSNTFQTFHSLYLQHFSRLKNAAKLIPT